MKFIACIGSRDISPTVYSMAKQLGAYIVNQGYCIKTGNAQGFDQAVAEGGNSQDPSKVFLYLPWSSYERQAIHPENKIFYADNADWSLASEHHPNWGKLSHGTIKLMLRNVGIVKDSNLVVAFLNHKKKGFGGTGHGWRVAESLSIPRIDFSIISFAECMEEIKSRMN